MGEIKRFDLTNGYAIVQLTKKYKEGTMSVEDASSQALPKIRREKKAAQVMNGASFNTLEDFATNHGVTTSNASAVTRKAPTIPGAGREPLVIGKAFALAEGETSGLIKGETGIFMIKVTKREEAITLSNFTTFAKTLTTQNQNAVNTNVFNALKENADIEDNRATFY